MASLKQMETRSTLDYDVCIKGIVIGDSSVGKSSLLYRYASQDWNPHYIATIGVDFKVLTFERQAKVVKLQLWDTAGQERFRTITQSYYRGAHGVLLVFDLTNEESFENVLNWASDAKKFGSSESVPLVLIGNKSDCVKQRVIPKERAEALARELGCKYVETSAKTNSGVDEAFEALVEECLLHRSKAVMIARERRPVNPILPTQKKDKSSTDICPC